MMETYSSLKRDAFLILALPFLILIMTRTYIKANRGEPAFFCVIVFIIIFGFEGSPKAHVEMGYNGDDNRRVSSIYDLYRVMTLRSLAI